MKETALVDCCPVVPKRHQDNWRRHRHCLKSDHPMGLLLPVSIKCWAVNRIFNSGATAYVWQHKFDAENNGFNWTMFSGRTFLNAQCGSPGWGKPGRGSARPWVGPFPPSPMGAIWLGTQSIENVAQRTANPPGTVCKPKGCLAIMWQ